MSLNNKTSIFIAATLSLLLMISASSCKNSKYKRRFVRPDTLCVDSATYSRTCQRPSGKDAKVYIRIDYPSPITGRLSAEIAAWERGRLGKGMPSDTMDAQNVVNYFGDDKYENFRNGYDKNTLAYSFVCRMVANRKNYVSFSYVEEQLNDGPHNIKWKGGITFRKSDGKAFGWNMLRDTASAKFHKLLREGVRSHFRKNLGEEKVTDDNLRSMLLPYFMKDDGAEKIFPGIASKVPKNDPLNHFPLPSTKPFLSKDGMTFVYPAYEIAPFSAGIIAFTVPFDDITPLMSKEGRSLLKKKK